LLAIIYFVPVFSPDSRAYTCAQLAGSHILLATRPVGFARFTGSVPLRPSHVAPHGTLCQPYVSHQARGLLAPRPCHAAQHCRLRAIQAMHMPGAQDSLGCASRMCPSACGPCAVLHVCAATPSCCFHSPLSHRPPCCRTWWSHIWREAEVD